MLRFIHAADVHLDSPLKGLEKYPGAPVDEIRGATRRALDNLIDLAIARKVDFVLIAGDLYDGDWKDHNTGLYFVNRMHRLREAGIPVVLISGNHDAANKMTRSLQLPDNVEMLPAGKPGSAKLSRFADLGVAIHGQSFEKAGEFGNLARGYPSKKSGLFNIGLLHTSLDGAEGHEPYAPCTIDDLRQKGYDYWALGHVHNRQICFADPHIVFPGNIQGRHIRENGAKGCYVVTVDAQSTCHLDFVPLDVFRWEICVVDIGQTRQPPEILDRFAIELERLASLHDGVPLAVRIVVTGAAATHEALRADQVRWSNELRASVFSSSSRQVWIEKIKWQTTPRQESGEITDQAGPVGTLQAILEELRNDPAELAGLAEELGDLQRKLPDELTHGEDAMAFNNPDLLRHWLDEVEPLLMSRLREGAGR
ncbi:MAG: DNA repair exonuclease [Planctomycetes bacterium]|nr:DNA repair exonuclease [Planctomycetota bacterium]